MEAVRKAEPGDARELAALSAACADALAHKRGGPLLLAHRRPPAGDFEPDALASLLADATRLTLVGTIDGVVVAMALGRVETLRDGDRLGRMDGCYVDPGARSIGLGHLLIDSLMAWFEAEHCVGADGIALPGDRDGKNFFESAGFKARLLVMHRTIEPG
ncbi:MAG TPA: GNAT family N-acetyltransferase [Acidimicrobiales bacterium]